MEDRKENAQAEETEQTEETEQAEETKETEYEETAEEKAYRKRRKRAIVFLVAVLAACAVLIPLFLFVDFDSAKNGLLGMNKKEILYSAPAFDENIWENEEYLALVSQMKVTVADGTGLSATYSFYDAESAEEAFAALSKHTNGAEVLGRYFAALIKGLEKSGSEEFAALFSKDYEKKIPTRFPCQKIYGITATCKGIAADNEDLYNWEVRFAVLDNDGLAVNYFDRQNNGGAWFRIMEKSDGTFVIAAIDTIYYN